MSNPPPARSASLAPLARPAAPAPTFPWAAWLTHVYTATGAGLAFLSLAAVVQGDIREAFVWLVLALGVDSSDGVLARTFRIKERLPEVDGAHLDDIIDYLTYVFVPLFLLYHTNRLPAQWGLAVVFAILIASVIAFSKSDAKTSDNFFTGFPSYWNVIAFYLYAFGASPGLNAGILLVLCLLIFVRTGYVYPSRTTTLRPVTVVFGCAWGVLMLFLLWQMPSIDRVLLWLSLSFPLYYTVLSLVLHCRRQP